MKKILVVSLMVLAGLTAVGAEAHEWHRGSYYRGDYYRHDGCRGCGWAPLAAGVIIGAELARPYPYIVNEPVYVQPQPVFVPQPALPQPPYGYHYEQIFDSQINAQRIVLVPN